MRAYSLIVGLVLLASAAAARADGGTLVIVGGGLDPANAEVFAALLDARPKGAPGIAIIPAASGEPQASAAAFKAALLRNGAAPNDIVTIRLAMLDDPATPELDESTWRANAEDKAEIAAIERAGAIWFTGGDQSRITALLMQTDGCDTPMLGAIRRRLAAGAVVGGTSAGAAIMSKTMITQGDSMGAFLGKSGGEPLGIGRGLGFLSSALVDQHFGERARLGRLAVVLTDPAQSQRIGFGIDEDTALIVSLGEGRAQVAGRGYVTVLDARAAQRTPGSRIGIKSLMLGLAGAGDSIDLARLAITPALVRKPTAGREYVKQPLRTGGGMAYGNQTLAAVIGEGLLDNAAATLAERHSFAGAKGVTYRFAKSATSQAWWGRNDDGRARYTIARVGFDVWPISVTIRKFSN